MIIHFEKNGDFTSTQYNSIHNVTMTSFAITLDSQCCRLHAVFWT